jgi:O-acetylhomoserine (thiol)-lyase
MTDLKLESLTVHAGCEPDPATNARITPIYQTASYVFDSAEHAADLFALKQFGNIYSRIMNPTNDALEKKIAALEGGVGALGLASGHAAQLVAFHTLMEPGCNIVAAKKLYGGSLNQMGEAFRKFGWETRFVDADDPANVRAAMDDKTRCVVTDIAAIADVAHDHGVPLIVDNTMATPMLCRPFEHGADIVTHSTTKFLNGHGNAVGGVIVDSGKFDWKAAGDKFPSLTQPNRSYHGAVLVDALEPIGPIAFITACRVLGLRDLGPAMAPQNAWLALTGMETLALRMERHCANALAVTEWLENHEQVAWVSYAGLETNAYKPLADRYLGGKGGAVFTFGLKGGYDAGVKLVSQVELFSHLANIGDTRSLIIHPASTTHSQLGEAELVAAGAGPDVVRISVGIEHVDDIIADLDKALQSL